MKKIYAKYTVELVKEDAHKYEVSTGKITSPYEVVELIDKVFRLSSKCEEYLILMCLDTKKQVTGLFEVSRGSLNSSIVHPREVFKRAMLCNSDSIVMIHNHPSGDTVPSGNDINITRRMKECGDVLGIILVDHIIMGSGSIRYESLKEKGLL